MPGMPLTRHSNAILADLSMTPEWWGGVLDRIACGDSPKEVVGEYCVLFGVFMRWVDADAGRRSGYDAALRIAAEAMAHECRAIADEQCEVVKPGGGTYDPDVGRDKLRIETRLKLAGKWHRDRYGDQGVQAVAPPVVQINIGIRRPVLEAVAGDTYSQPGERPGARIEQQEAVPAAVATPTLAATIPDADRYGL